MSEIVSKYRGCMLGGAVGDALGAPIEFMSITAIRSRYGARGISDFDAAYGRVGAITDDTQMTLFTAEGILRAWLRSSARGICGWSGVIANAYRRWLLTQSERVLDAAGHRDIPTDGWLFSIEQLHSQRAPGRTCISALQMTPRGEPANNNSKGCGGVMRVAPAGLFGRHFKRPGALADTFRLGSDAAALTHGHSTGHLSAGVFAALVHGLLDGASIDAALDAAISILVTRPGHEETLAALNAARALARVSETAGIEALGQGWIAEEALAMSVYASLVSPDFESGVLRAVNHSGDSDSTGAITGNLLGAIHGVEAIPHRWLDALELRDVIADMADDLAECILWDADPLAPTDARTERALLRYPPH